MLVGMAVVMFVLCAGEYDYAIAFQERIRIPDDKMDYYKDLAEMYVGDDVSPDFYGWVFPKYDHVAVGEYTASLAFWVVPQHCPIKPWRGKFCMTSHESSNSAIIVPKMHV